MKTKLLKFLFIFCIGILINQADACGFLCEKSCVCGYAGHHTLTSTFTKSEAIIEDQPGDSANAAPPSYTSATGKTHTTADLDADRRVVYDFKSILSDATIDRACVGCDSFFCCCGIPCIPCIPCGYPLCGKKVIESLDSTEEIKKGLLKFTPFLRDTTKVFVELESFSITTEKIPKLEKGKKVRYKTLLPGFTFIATTEDGKSWGEGTRVETLKLVAKRADNVEAYENYERATQQSFTQTDLNKKEAYEAVESYATYEPTSFSHFDGQEVSFTFSGKEVQVCLENLKTTGGFSQYYLKCLNPCEEDDD